MPSRHRAYLAGYEVFLPCGPAVIEIRKAICAKHGFEGVWCIDTDKAPDGIERQALGAHIFRGNVRLISTCDLMIANMTPFRGPSMDVGTAWEMGLARGIGIPSFGFSEDLRDYAKRIEKTRPVAGRLVDGDGRYVEDFGLCDNLMMACDAIEHGGEVFPSFEAAVLAAKAAFAARTQQPSHDGERHA